MASTYLNEVLALGLGDERLQLGGGEGIDETRLRDNQQEHLGAGENGQLVSLFGKLRDSSQQTKYIKCYHCFDIFFPSDRVHIATRRVRTCPA